MTISLAASIAIRQARKAVKSRKVFVGDIGTPMFLSEATLYEKTFKRDTDDEYSRTMIRGIDAVSNSSVTNIEYHGRPFDGTRKNICLEKFYKTVWTNPTTGIKREYEHIGNIREDLSDNETFHILVKMAQEEQANEVEAEVQTAHTSVC